MNAFSIFTAAALAFSVGALASPSLAQSIEAEAAAAGFELPDIAPTGPNQMEQRLADGYRIFAVTAGTNASSASVYHLMKGTDVIRCFLPHAQPNRVRCP
ncbi:MAG: hypothetical protein AAF841_03000 [Pseudomonadota bacterium]